MCVFVYVCLWGQLLETGPVLRKAVAVGSKDCFCVRLFLLSTFYCPCLTSLHYADKSPFGMIKSVNQFFIISCFLFKCKNANKLHCNVNNREQVHATGLRCWLSMHMRLR